MTQTAAASTDPSSGDATPRRSRLPRLAWPALAGVAAYGLGVGVAELAAVVVSPRATPVVAVSDTVIELSPRWATELAISLFGTRDKLFLVSLVAVVAVVLAGLAGILESRRRSTGIALTVALAIGMSAAAVTRPGADTFAFVPGLVAGLVAVAALPPLLRRAENPSSGPDRRSVVVVGALALAGVMGAAAGVLGGRVRGVASSRGDLVLPAASEPAPPVPGSATFDDVPGLSAFQTPTTSFYRIDTAIVVPTVDPDAWRLRIHGMVDREYEIGLADVLDRDLVETWATLTCVSNQVGGDLIGNARWLGVPTARLLAAARPRPDADMVLSTSADGFTAGTPLEALTDDRGALLAVGMNGEPLPVQHGFPARLVVPGLYGYVSATKWVVDLEVTRFADAEAYWTVRGWAERGPVKLSSRIDRPTSQAPREADGTVVLAGVAWAQDVGVAGVEVRIDEGEWTAAELAEAGTSSTWRQWRYVWTPDGDGRHSVAVRATDVEGRVQVGEPSEPFPDGATGYHQVLLTVV